ncbi:hypothetical protein F441_20419 [Phytophthora nicotianae CJ01A1]|uniref:Uncharacterized protein n=1 Tax=Phytophthora nicotianae CJ01A1 TaxID=1317063 RepID=W2VWG5_PHYNI|nr:hypothetical protein F441_20419 [Phytophthora nicotianae CJ01A1]
MNALIIECESKAPMDIFPKKLYQRYLRNPDTQNLCTKHKAAWMKSALI